MNPQTRSLLVIGFIALVGLGALALMASQYSSILEERPGAAPTAQANHERDTPSTLDRQSGALASVDRFIEARRRIKRALSTSDAPSEPEDASRRLLAARERALVGVGWSLEDYAAVRELYRDWRDQRAGVMGPIVDAFELRIDQLREVELGSFESFDV
jgi:hypothetical protein